MPGRLRDWTAKSWRQDWAWNKLRQGGTLLLNERQRESAIVICDLDPMLKDCWYEKSQSFLRFATANNEFFPKKGGPGSTGPPSSVLGLIVELQRQLHDPGIARTGDLAEAGRAQRGAHRIEIGVVEHVEGLGAELEVRAFRDGNVFHQANIPSGEAGAENGAPSCVSGASIGRCGKCSGVEPFRQSRRTRIRISYLIGASAGGTGAESYAMAGGI